MIPKANGKVAPQVPQPPNCTGNQQNHNNRSLTAKGLPTKYAATVANVDTTRTSLANGPASQRRKPRDTRALKGPTTNAPTLRCRKAEDNRAPVGHLANGRQQALRHCKFIAPCSAHATGPATISRYTAADEASHAT
uniref:Uncharacterized protein n=1 Tax=Glossina austeni TaxID=7395 RepID=A0A1A9VL51_GLOAU